jgi:hypothetical protein
MAPPWAGTKAADESLTLTPGESRPSEARDSGEAVRSRKAAQPRRSTEATRRAGKSVSTPAQGRSAARRDEEVRAASSCSAFPAAGTGVAAPMASTSAATGRGSYPRRCTKSDGQSRSPDESCKRQMVHDVHFPARSLNPCPHSPTNVRR